MKKSFFLFLIFLFFVLYYFFFPLTADKEHIWLPQLVLNLEEIHDGAFAILEDSVLVQTAEYSGVLSPEGGSVISNSSSGIKKYSFSHSFEYTALNKSVLKNRINNRYFVFEEPGYPLILGDRFFLADLSASIIREVSSSGGTLWSWEGVSPITAISSADMNTIFGTLDGKVHIFRKDGKQEILDNPDNSGDSIVYGISLSPDNNFLAIVYGRKEQYLLLYREKSPMEYVETGKFLLDSHFTRPIKVEVSLRESSVWVEQEGKIRRYREDGEVTDYPFEGSLLTMIPDESNEIVYILSTLPSAVSSLVTACSLEGNLLFSDKIKGIPSHFKMNNSQLTLIEGNEIIVFHIGEY